MKRPTDSELVRTKEILNYLVEVLNGCSSPMGRDYQNHVAGILAKAAISMPPDMDAVPDIDEDENA